MTRPVVVAAKIGVADGNNLLTLGVANRSYFQSAAGLINRTWYPILDPAISVSSEVSLPWEGGTPSLDFGDLILDSGGDGEYEDLIDFLLGRQLAGVLSIVKRGYIDQNWDNLEEEVYRAHTQSVRVDGRRMVLSQQSTLRAMENPLATRVFDETTPNPRLVNKTVPLLIGPSFQIDPMIWDPPNEVYFVAENASNISLVRAGGAITTNFVQWESGIQLLANPRFQITVDAIGPAPESGQLSETTVIDWDFTAWTSNDPDSIDVTENPPEAEIIESPAGGEADITVQATPTGNTGWISLTNPIEPLFASVSGNKDWTVGGAGAASVEDAVVADDGSWAEATIFGPSTLRVGGFDPGVPDGFAITGVEIELIAEGTNTKILVLTANQRSPGTRVAAYVDQDGGVANSGITPTSITNAKQTIVGGNTNFIGGGFGVREDVSAEDVNAAGMHFTLKVEPETPGSATVKIYQVRLRVHYAPTIDLVRLFSPTSVLEPGKRHTVRIKFVAADIYARWGSSDASGGELRDASDPFSTSLAKLESSGSFEFEFVPEPGETFFGIEFKRLNLGGTATIESIQVSKRTDGLNRYKTLVPYMAGLVGLDPVNDVDQSLIDEHDAATGSPEMGRYIIGNESMTEIMGLFARSLSGVWWPGRDGKLRSALWTKPPGVSADFVVDTIALDDLERSTRISGNPIIESDPAPDATERAVGGRNVRPLRFNETAGITEEFNAQERANVLEDWRVRRRANFDSLNPWTGVEPLSISAINPTSGDEGGGTSVTITGTGFEPGATVEFDGVAALDVDVVSDTMITATTPAGTGDADVTVRQGEESVTLVGGFTFTMAGAWTPAQITTELWLDASDDTTVTLDGSGNVEQWDDKSGNARNAVQGTASRRPGYTSGVSIDFGGSHMLVAPYFDFPEGIVFVVTDTVATGQQHIIRDDPSGNWRHIIRYNSSTEFIGGVQTNSASNGSPVATDQNLHVFAIRWMASDQLQKVFQDSVEKLSTLVAGTELLGASGGVDPPSIGSHPSFADQLNGTIREIVYVPSDIDRQKVEGYLAHKWDAITGTTELVDALPGSHPYKNAPP